MKKFAQIANLLSVVFAIGANALVATSANLPAIGSVSATYSTLLTPATYAFSIWTLIYIMIALLALWQARDIFSPSSENNLPEKLGGWFILANVMNGLWTYVFVSGEIALSVVVILALLTALFTLIKRLNIAMVSASLKEICLVWWPILLYTGWVLVASVVNIFAFLSSVGIILTAVGAAATLIGLFALLSVLLWRRNVRALVLASSWGIAAVAAAQYSGDSLVFAIATAVTVLLLIQVSMHAYDNRKTNPFRSS